MEDDRVEIGENIPGIKKQQPQLLEPQKVIDANNIENKQQDPENIPRRIGLVTGAAMIVGIMIGSGIFVSPKGVLARTGSVALSLCVWALAGVYSMLGSLCYIELGLLIPESGCDFAYLLHGLGPLHRFFGPLPAFLYTWAVNLIANTAGTAIVGLACAEYCIQPFYQNESSPPPFAIPVVALGFLWISVGMNCYSTKLGASVQSVFSVAKLAVIAVIVAAGVYSLSQGNTHHLATGFKGSTTSASDVAAAFFGGMWAYSGFNSLNFLTEEITKPSRNLPLATMIALPLVTICYILTNVAYLTVLSPEELLKSPAVANSFAERILGPAYFIVPLGVVITVSGCLNGSVIIVARCFWASARQGHLPEIVSYLHSNSLTPAPAIIVYAIITSIMICVGRIDTLIDVFSVIMLVFYSLSICTLIIMRHTRRNAPRPFRVPLVIACLVVFVSWFLVIWPIATAPQLQYLLVAAYMVLGVIVYTVLIYFKWTPFDTCMSKVTDWLRRFLNLVPSALPSGQNCT